MRRFAALLLSLAPVMAHAATSPVIAAAVADQARPDADLKADAIRKPEETLAFAGVRPGMKVGEFYPGSGYFTRLLSAVVGPKGHVYGIENARWVNAVKADGGIAGGNVSVEAAPFGTVRFAEPIDLAWVTQNYHDLKIAEYGIVDTAEFNKAVFAALKPGGAYFILDHDAPAGTDTAAIARLHRIEKAQVIREVKAAGFRLVSEGAFLSNPADDHSLSIFDKAIQGKTDQYALKFVKPAKTGKAR